MIEKGGEKKMSWAKKMKNNVKQKMKYNQAWAGNKERSEEGCNEKRNKQNSEENDGRQWKEGEDWALWGRGE